MAESEPTSCERLGVDWKTSSSSLADLKDVLPHICKYEGDKLPFGLKLYSQQPVLLYRWYRKRKANVRTIYRDETGPYYEVGQTLQIPIDFEGWFELVPPDFGRGRYFESFEQISKEMPEKVFCRTNLSGIKIEYTGENENNYVTRKVQAGSILKINRKFSAKWKTCAEVGIRKKQQKEWITKEIHYLQCTDREGEDLLVPYTTKGKFYSIYKKESNDSKCVFRMKDILSDFTLPIKVRLLYGKPPVVPCIFTGIMVIKSCTEEDCVVGSTITFKRHALFELPVSDDLKIFTPTSSEIFEDMKSYQDAKKLCEKYSEVYSSLIKLSPELGTDQNMIQHIPTEKSKQRHESLKTLDLITNISLTDDEPRAQSMESSSDGDNVSEQCLTTGTLLELTEMPDRSSMMC